jgi:hypothetical protein
MARPWLAGAGGAVEAGVAGALVLAGAALEDDEPPDDDLEQPDAARASARARVGAQRNVIGESSQSPGSRKGGTNR